MAADQTLRVIGAYAPPSLYPTLAGGGDVDVMTGVTHLPAFYLDKDGKMQPGICTSYDVSDDGLTYTLHVNPSAKFSDGSPVTAGDLKFTYELLAYPESKTWSSAFIDGPIKGYKDVLAGTTKDMAGLVAKDDKTLVITLSAPYTPFIKATACFFTGIVSKADVTKAGANWSENPKPVCCGPFMVDSWNKDTGDISWVPNPNWWGNKPRLTKVTYKVTKDDNTRSIQYDNNEMDLMMNYNATIIAQQKKGAHAAELHLIPTSGIYFFQFALGLKPMEDVNVRRALLKATDMATIVPAVLQGGEDPAFGIIAPNQDGFRNLKPYYDPEGAKQALASSTYKTAGALPPLSFAINSNSLQFVQVAEAMQQGWKQILGIDVTIHKYDKATDPAITQAQILRRSLGTVILDTSSSVSALGESDSSVVLSFKTGLKNTELDGILKKADALPLSQESERVKLYQQAEDIMMDQAYYIPIGLVQYYFNVKPWVKNFESNNDYSGYTMDQVYIAQH